MSIAIPHAQQRSMERYSRPLSKHKARQITSMIRNGKSTNNHRLTNGRSEHTVTIDDERWRVVYSKTTKKIVTCLPLDNPYL